MPTLIVGPRPPIGRCHPQPSSSAAGAGPRPRPGCPWTAPGHLLGLAPPDDHGWSTTAPAPAGRSSVSFTRPWPQAARALGRRGRAAGRSGSRELDHRVDIAWTPPRRGHSPAGTSPFPSHACTCMPPGMIPIVT